MVVELTDIRRVFKEKESSFEVPAVDGISMQIAQGEFMSIMGASGSGKSTLLHILGCLDKPTSGKYLLDGEDISGMDDARLAELRNARIGFVFQTFNLIPQLTILENVELPMLYSGKHINRERCVELITMVGLKGRITFRPTQLSGGEMQRVAIARSLVNNPALLLADEPTGNLDSKSSRDIIDVFKELNSMGHTIVVVTHEDDIAGHTRRIVHLSDGKIIKDEKVTG